MERNKKDETGINIQSISIDKNYIITDVTAYKKISGNLNCENKK